MPPLATLTLMLLGPTLCGTALVALSNSLREKTAIAATGTILGLALAVTLTYVLTPLLSIAGAGYTIATTMLAIGIYLWSAHPTTRQQWEKQPLDKIALIVTVSTFALAALITPNLLFEEKGNLYVGAINAWGDLGFHAALITNLRDSSSLITQNPILAGHRLVYPFLSDFFSATLLAENISLVTAIVIPALILIPITLILLYCYTRDLTKSKTAAVLALVLFTLGGSMGWTKLPADLMESKQSVHAFLQQLPADYTGHSTNTEGYRLINPINSLLLPQRAFLFGMPLALAIILILTNAKKERKTPFILAGILSGITPLFHAHTVLALIPAIIASMIVKPTKKWGYFIAAAGVIGLPEVLYYTTSNSSASALPHIQLGWMAHEENILVFWFQNAGLLVPLTLIGLSLPTNKTLKALTLAGLALFAAGNIWRFAAWEWDNTKIFVYWILLTLPSIGVLITHLTQNKEPILKTIGVALILMHTGSGALDLYQFTRPKPHKWLEWDKDSVAMAEQIREHTQPGESVVAAPIHNSAVALSGRPVYLGFPGHVWTHGGDYTQREAAIKSWYEGKSITFPEIIPDYTLVGPTERAQYPALKIQPTWKLITQYKSYALYAIPEP